MSGVQGTCAPGFEPVAELLDSRAGDVWSGGAAFAGFAGGEPVVDIWVGDRAPAQRWDRDTLGVLMSATKGVTTLALQLLVDRGELEIEAPMTKYWPEFGAAGKESATVEHLLTHQLGVVALPAHETLLSWDGRGWADYDAIADRLAAAPPEWPPGSAYGYHAMTFGWLAGELIRRLTGGTLGEYIAREIAAPLELDLRLGSDDAAFARTARVVAPTAPPGLSLPFVDAGDDPSTLQGRALVWMEGGNGLRRIEDLVNHPLPMRAELGGSNGTATARALARMYACLAAGGENLLRRNTVELFAEERVNELDVVTMLPGRRALGYVLATPAPPPMQRQWGPSDSAFGHPGYGGQLGFADAGRNVAIAFVRNHLEFLPSLGGALVDELYACLDRRTSA